MGEVSYITLGVWLYWFGEKLLTKHRFHDENTREEDLTHPEDIAHFASHDKLEEEQERIEALQKRNIVAENIPPMFRIKN